MRRSHCTTRNAAFMPTVPLHASRREPLISSLRLHRPIHFNRSHADRRLGMCAGSPAFLDVSKLQEQAGAKLRSGIRISLDPPTLVSDTAISRNSEILSVSDSSVLSPRSALDIFGTEAEDLSDAAILAALLLKERACGDSSPFSTLITGLPSIESLHQPFLWSDDELSKLKGSTMYDTILEVREGLRTEWESVRRLSKLTIQFDDYLWAQAIVASRAFALDSSDNSLVLSPLIDFAVFIGDKSNANSVVSVGGGGFFSKRRYILSATKNIAAGEFIRACPVSSNATAAEYILDYGRLPDKALAAVIVDVSFALASLDPFYEDKLEILEANGVATSCAFSVQQSSARGLWKVPVGLMQFLRLVCLERSDAFLLEAIFRNDVWGFMDLPVSAKNEKTVCEAVMAACADILERYPENQNASEKFDESKDRTAIRARLAKSIVDAEKDALRSCIDHFKREIQQLDTVQYYQERRLNELDLLRPLEESEIVDAEAGRRMSQAFDDNY